mmetsp:Transcript_5755/g.16600  ORF Transcript_5755/g.16600 Transcript_5755/m.16600 type:complete len:211 (-) Transcript_5755:1769-2401(-)
MAIPSRDWGGPPRRKRCSSRNARGNFALRRMSAFAASCRRRGPPFRLRFLGTTFAAFRIRLGRIVFLIRPCRLLLGMDISKAADLVRWPHFKKGRREERDAGKPKTKLEMSPKGSLIVILHVGIQCSVQEAMRKGVLGVRVLVTSRKAKVIVTQANRQLFQMWRSTSSFGLTWTKHRKISQRRKNSSKRPRPTSRFCKIERLNSIRSLCS